MEPEGSLPHSQMPANCPYPESARSSPYPHIPHLEDTFNIILPYLPRSRTLSLSLRFHHQNPVYSFALSIYSTCPTNLILLDFITRTILCEQYRSLSSSLCSFLHSPVNSSLLGPNIPPSTLFSTVSDWNGNGMGRKLSCQFEMPSPVYLEKLCSFLHSPVTSSLLGPNILLSHSIGKPTHAHF